MRFTAHRDRLHRAKKRDFNNACRFYSRPNNLNDSIVLSCHLNSFVEKGRAEAERDGGRLSRCFVKKDWSHSKTREGF